MRHFKFMLVCLLFAAPLMAGPDAGDAPAPYPIADLVSFSGPHLGTLFTADASNPVIPAWTGDDDDGIVGATPAWTVGTNTNSLTVSLTILGYGDEHLVMWVDANDDGNWTVDERYHYGNAELPASGTYTFNNIFLPTMNYALNGPNKVAVRIVVLYSWFGVVPADGGDMLYAEGEVEDWLIDVNPIGFVVSTDGPLPVAREGSYYGMWFDAINGAPPYTWSVAGGALPPGLLISTVSDQGLVDGDLAVNSGSPFGVTYDFDLMVTDSTNATAIRSYSIYVLPPPQVIPFRDDFSSHKGWTYGPTWTRGQASGASFAVGNLMIHEPAMDATPGSNDNMILADSMGGAYGQYNASKWVTSPELDCSAAGVVLLRFKRFLSIDNWFYDKARIEVCNDGVNWIAVWTSFGPGGSSAPPTIDTDWSSREIDISGMAAGQPIVQVRFGIGATDAQNNYAGWCIDDFEVLPAPNYAALGLGGLTVQTPATVGGVDACYKGSCYTFKASLDNHTTETLTLDFTSVALAPLGSATPHEAGPVTLPSPIVIQPLATGYIVTGVFNVTTLPAPGAGQYLMVVRFWGSGTGGTWVEGSVGHLIELNLGPGTPGHLEVYDGAQFLINPAAAVGGRDFGTRDVNLGPSPALNISVRNTGSNPISIALPVLSNTADFTLDLSQWPAALGGGTTAIIGVRFDPAGIGNRACNLTFTHSATLSSDTPFVIALKGIGVDNVAAIELRETDIAGAVIAYASAATGGRDFGTRDINSGLSTVLTIRIANVGAQTLTLPGWPSLSGADAADFGLDYTGINRRLRPGASTMIRVWFDPMTIGAKSAKVMINHNGLNEPTPFEFDIAGVAVLIAPQLLVRELTPTGAIVMPDCVAVGSARDFGLRNIFAGPTTTLGIFVCNTGNADLVISQPVLTGASLDFVLTAAQAVIVPGDWRMLMVAFDPASIGAKSAWLEFANNAGPLFRCELAGIGEFPQPLSFQTTALLPSVEVHASYGPVWIAAQGGTAPYTYVLGGALPTGLIFNDAGRIIGAAECAPGLYQFDITVTDAMGDFVTQNFAIEVTPVFVPDVPPETVLGDSSPSAGCQANASGISWGLLLFGLLTLSAVASRRRLSRAANGDRRERCRRKRNAFSRQERSEV